ncbi:hypothetical protein QJS10_CPB20g01265 [Acorus calamus]|uniref:AT-hook motif nuclear-localized protein n=1 Tax=Acorus calamus TaxID=4465 RepID=A0AAV9CBI1_ACOCL|nr:hypothetical protein QJS10_CPB20g01265 [Acorus calamus]
MALALRPFGSPGSGNQSTPSSDPLAPKRKGRPPGSRNKQHMDALGPPGTGFTPHVITVQAGEDVASKIMSFSQRSPRTVCIISASGSISNVTLRQAATSGGTVTYEGRFEILSLSGSFMFTENGGTRSRTGGLSVSLAGSDGRVLGGSVAGMLLAASPIQVVLGSFIADGKKPKPEQAQEPPPSHMAGFGGPMGASTPSQRTSSESSDDPGSPIDESGRVGNNSGHHHMHNMPAYTHLSWGGSHGAN